MITNTATGKSYATIKLAAIDVGCSISAISGSIRKGYRCKGAYWQREGSPVALKKTPKPRCVVNTLSGETFADVAAVAAAIEIDELIIRQCIYHGRKLKDTYWDWIE